jgi:hypothetical protein
VRGKNMNKVSYAVKIEPSLADKVKKFCLEHGIKQGYFVEKALKEQLAKEELLEDLLDIKSLKSQEKDAISFEEYLSKRDG